MDVYDFYKPSLDSEYPAVDGKLSQTCYIKAVDDCYTGHLDKMVATGALTAGHGARKSLPYPFPTVDTAFDHTLFHSPYNKLVQQSFRRMLFNDARRFIAAGLPLPAHLAKLAPFASLPYAETITNRDLDKLLASIGQEQYDASVGPTNHFSQNIGNSYTAALWTNLLSTVDKLGSSLNDKRLGMFSYGSGALATMFAMDAVESPSAAKVNPKFTLSGIQKTANISARLAARKQCTPEEFTAALDSREQSYGKNAFVPTGSIDNVPSGAWYLKEVNADHTRVYDRKN